MSRRKATSSKRQRTDAIPIFGAPSDADSPSAQNNDNPSSSASSSRTFSPTVVPPLTTICARVFAKNFVKLRGNETLWQNTVQYLQILPDTLVAKVFAMVASSCPTYLPHEVIVTYFCRGPTISLSSSLTGVSKRTVLAIGRLDSNTGLRELHLSGFEKIPDDAFASILPKLTSLRELVLRGCSKVGTLTVTAAANSCPRLKLLNLNYTSAPPAAVGLLVNACRDLEVLKLAGITSWTDGTFAKFISAINISDGKPLSIQTLKLRQTSLSDISLSSFISLCPQLKRLDASFTAIHHIPRLTTSADIPALEKLSLTSTQVSGADLLTVLSQLPHLRTLSIGALGIHQGSISNSSAMTMNDETLRGLTSILANFQHIENVNLIGNTKLNMTSRGDTALLDFITRVGRRCKWLNLSALPSLRSLDLSGLLNPNGDFAPSELRTLILNNTGIDDDAAPFISSCPHLVTLEVSGTKMTQEGLMPIVDACSKLENLDITSCRGVRVADRRRFFEIWEQEREGS